MKPIVMLMDRIRGSLLARNTIVYTFNFGMQLVIQFGYFMLISRYLGPSDYGVFVTLSSVNGIGVLLIGLGSDHVMIQRAAVDRANMGRYLGHSIAMSGLTMPLIGLLAVIISFHLVGERLALSSLLAFVTAHLIFGRIVAICAGVNSPLRVEASRSSTRARSPASAMGEAGISSSFRRQTLRIVSAAVSSFWRSAGPISHRGARKRAITRRASRYFGSTAVAAST